MLVSEKILFSVVSAIFATGVTWGIFHKSVRDLTRLVRNHDQILHGKDGEVAPQFVLRGECKQARDLQCKKIDKLSDTLCELAKNLNDLTIYLRTDITQTFSESNNRWDKVVTEHTDILNKIHESLQKLQVKGG